MVDVVIEVMAESWHHTSKDGLNPFWAQTGEILPSTPERNVRGFLVRMDAISINVDSQKLLAWIKILQDQLVIAKLLGPKPNSRGLEMWIQTLNQELGGTNLTLCREVGKVYSFSCSNKRKPRSTRLSWCPPLKQNGGRACYNARYLDSTQITPTT